MSGPLLCPEFSSSCCLLATANDCPDYQWYHDTGCNHHVTNELENLNVHVDAYDGPNQIKVGNGQGLRILRTGTATLPSSNHNSSFIFTSCSSNREILYPLINLLVTMVYLLNFFVKDLRSRKLLLQGLSRNGLYPWPPSHPSFNKPIANIGEKFPMDDWHRQLGHPAPPIVRRVLCSDKLLVSSSSSQASICSSCQQGKSHCRHFPKSLSVSSTRLQ